MGIKISKDHLHPSVIESITSLIGDLSQLETTAKGNAVEAINELLANGGNKEELEALIAEITEGKGLIANAFGEPLTAEDSFDKMNIDINSLLSTFKTNMMNNGITVESGDKFKQLIDKIATMVEEGSGKGIQFAEGECNVSNIGDIKQFAYMTNATASESYRYGSITLDFVPQFVYFRILYVYYVYSVPMKFITHVIYDPLENNCLTIINSSIGAGDGSIYNNSVEATIDHFVPIIEDNTYYYPVLEDDGKSTIEYSISDSYWYAIGVGEEDTTLRDSLAGILGDKGIEVSPDDDMASLISKVSLFDDYTPSPLYIVNNGVVNTDFKIIKQSSGYSMTQNSDHILFNIPKGTSNNSMAISTSTKFNLTNYSNIVVRYYASGGRFDLGINTVQSNSNYNNYVQWLGENQVNQEATYRFNISNYNDEYYIIIDVDNLSASVTSTLKIYDIYLEK